MDESAQQKSNNCLPPVSNAGAAIRHFQEGLAAGKHWYITLLEAIGLWTDEVETVGGHHYHYLIEGEAFDWLLLAQRLCETVIGLVPENERYALIFENKPPLQLSPEEFKNLIGSAKYRQFLNFFYGVTVEEALLQAVREEVRKERHSNCRNSRYGEEEETFNRVYCETESSLFKRFRKEKHYSQYASSSLSELKEFTYWRFKHRLRTSEKARVASDTHKALEWLRRNRSPLFIHSV
jgi:TfoX/Sxy family transcriptional regulator of competence genes